MFGIKKKEKVKKPWTMARFVKLISPLLLIVIIVLSGYQAFSECGGLFDKYKRLQAELEKDFDVSTMLTSNKINAIDDQTLKTKLGDDGADCEIFVAGDINAEVFNSLLVIDMSNSVQLLDSEFGVLANKILDENSLGYTIDLLEVTITNAIDNYKLITVARIDISNLQEEINIDIEGIKSIYIRSECDIRLENNNLIISNEASQINALNSDDNKEVLKLLRIVIGGENSIPNLLVKLAKDFSLKTDTYIMLAQNRIGFLK